MQDKARPLIIALSRACGDLFAPALRRVVVLSLAFSIATFAILWSAIATLLDNLALFQWRALNWLVDLLGAVAVLGLSWLLFPTIATMVMGLFLDRVANAVEARHYPQNITSRRVSIGETARTTLRLTGLTILLNILALPVYLLAPGVNFFVFLGLNGYLFGREYFEVVALRRLDPVAARQMRRQFAGSLFVGGAAISGMFALPLVNFVAPVFATAFMVHMFEGLRRIEPLPSTW